MIIFWKNYKCSKSQLCFYGLNHFVQFVIIRYYSVAAYTEYYIQWLKIQLGRHIYSMIKVQNDQTPDWEKN